MHPKINIAIPISREGVLGQQQKNLFRKNAARRQNETIVIARFRSEFRQKRKRMAPPRERERARSVFPIAVLVVLFFFGQVMDLTLFFYS